MEYDIEISHSTKYHGVKGMKWGVRKERLSGGLKFMQTVY